MRAAAAAALPYGVPYCSCELTKGTVHAAVADGKCAVIGMQSTGEAALNAWLNDHADLDGQARSRETALRPCSLPFLDTPTAFP